MNLKHGLAKITLIFILLLLVAAPAYAQSSEITWIEGPKMVDLGDNLAQIDMSEAYVFAGPEDTRMIMEAAGNPPSDQEVGMIVPKAEGEDWFLVFEYDPAGYVSDDEKDSLDADAILQSIREGTEEANQYRAERGISPLHIIGWYEKPHYDTKTNNLVWAIVADSEHDGKVEQVVNYNVRVLGRTGYMSVVLVTDPETLAVYKPKVEDVLSKFSYKVGKTYAEYVQGDKLATIGLTALVAGGAGAAAAKAGFFKVIGKFAKYIIMALIVFFGAIWRRIQALFGSGRARNLPVEPAQAASEEAIIEQGEETPVR